MWQADPIMLICLVMKYITQMLPLSLTLSWDFLLSVRCLLTFDCYFPLKSIRLGHVTHVIIIRIIEIIIIITYLL